MLSARLKSHADRVTNSPISCRRKGFPNGLKKSSADHLKNFGFEALGARDGVARVKNHAHEYMT
jgi:hypothetical protein